MSSLTIFGSAWEKALQRHSKFLAILHQGANRAILTRVKEHIVTYNTLHAVTSVGAEYCIWIWDNRSRHLKIFIFSKSTQLRRLGCCRLCLFGPQQWHMEAQISAHSVFFMLWTHICTLLVRPELTHTVLSIPFWRMGWGLGLSLMIININIGQEGPYSYRMAVNTQRHRMVKG